MFGGVLVALIRREVDPFLQAPNVISQPRWHRWCPLLPTATLNGMKYQVRFIRDGIEVVRANLRGERRLLPLTAAPDTG
jgi:hypothetical protein